jgi:Pregnancy-associated plasma protein-A/PKD domain
MKKIKKQILNTLTLIALFIVLLTSISQAQTAVPNFTTALLAHQDSLKSMHWSCGAEVTSFQNNIAAYNKYVENFSTYKINGTTSTTSGTKVIPVVVHVLYDAAHATNANFNITYNQIQWQILALNTAFQNNYIYYTSFTAGSIGAHAVNTQIQFCLAKFTMGGVSWTSANEPGVMRYQVPTAILSHTMDLAGRTQLLSNTSNFPAQNYLNVYLVNDITDISGTLPNPNVIGYANFPSTLSATNPLDGIVMRHDVFGDNTLSYSNCLLIPQLDKGRIFAHEVGHYLGLFHTFTGGCVGDNASNCSTQGDLLCDTPPSTTLNTSVCSVLNTCLDNLPIYLGIDQPDMLENFMSYADDNCMNTFTNEQSTLMNGVLNTAWPTGRLDMTTTTNLAATGLSTAFGCCPTGVLSSYFNASVSACNSFYFNCSTQPCFSNINYTWNFGDGTIITNTSNTISHTFVNSGIHTIILTVTNALGSVSTSSLVVNSGTWAKSSAKTICNNSYQGVNIHTTTGFLLAPSTFSVATTINGVVTQNTVAASYGYNTPSFLRGFEDYETHYLVSTTLPLPAQLIYTVTVAGTLCNLTYIDTFTVVDCCDNLITNGNFNSLATNFTTDLCTPVTNNWCYTWGIANGYLPYFPGWSFNPTIWIDVLGCYSSPTCTTLNIYNTNFSVKQNTTYHINYLTPGGHYPSIANNPNGTDTLLMNVQVVDPLGNIIYNHGSFPVLGLNSSWHHQNFTFNSGAFNGIGTLKIQQVKNFGGYGFDYGLDEISVRAINPISTIISPTLSSICSGQSVNLNAIVSPTNTTYTYTWLPNTSLSCANCPSPNASPSTTTIYSLSVKDNNLCTSKSTATISVIPSSTITITTTNPLSCSGSTTLTASGSSSYTWQPSGFVGNPLITSIASTYTVFAGGCATTATAIVNPPTAASPCINTHTFGTNITIAANTIFTATGTYNNYNFTCFGTINVPNNAITTFSNCTFMMAPNTAINLGNKAYVRIIKSHLYGCSNLWKGIITPSQIGATLDITSTLIEDAFWGVYMPAAGSTNTNSTPNRLRVYNCLFNTNATDIDYTNTNKNELLVENSAFTSRCLDPNYDPPFIPLPTINLNFYNTKIIYAPFVQPLGGIIAPNYGIIMREAYQNPGSGSQITLQKFNVFDKHLIGISTLNFNTLKIEKQLFVNGITDNSFPISNVGIIITNSNQNAASNPNNNFVINIGDINKSNSFQNLNYGIYANAPYASKIRTRVVYNTFPNPNPLGISSNGVPSHGSPAFVGSHYIANNNFSNCANAAIKIANSQKTGMSITNNNISVTTVQNSASDYKGIIISEITNPITAKYSITTNTLTNINRAIMANNVNTAVIQNNRINLAPSNIAIAQATGINLINCNAPSIISNSVTGTGTAAFASTDIGIFVADCPQGRYSCNNLKNTLFGTSFNGQSISTTLGQNTFDNNAAAIFLSNNGFIDQQGNSSPSGASDNTFLNINTGQYHTYAATVGSVPTFGQNSPFFIRNTPSQFNMTNNGFDNNFPPSNVVQINIITNPLAYINDCAGGNTGSSSALATKIASSGLFSPTLVRENHTSKRQLFKQLQPMASLPNATLQAFKTANATTCLGKLTMVDSSISNYFNGSANALLQAKQYNTFTCANTVEHYQQQVNALYLQYLQTYSLTTTQITQVNAIAALCPYTDGTAVWQARTFAKVFNPKAEFFNVCERVELLIRKASVARLGAITTDIETKEIETIIGTLVPNPNDGNFSIVTNQLANTLKAEVYNLHGKLVCTGTANNTHQLAILCEDLSNGIYFVKVFINTNYSKTHRLIITK